MPVSSLPMHLIYQFLYPASLFLELLRNDILSLRLNSSLLSDLHTTVLVLLSYVSISLFLLKLPGPSFTAWNAPDLSTSCPLHVLSLYPHLCLPGSSHPWSHILNVISSLKTSPANFLLLSLLTPFLAFFTTHNYIFILTWWLLECKFHKGFVWFCVSTQHQPIPSAYGNVWHRIDV